MGPEAVLRLQGLTVALRDGTPIVEDVGLEVARGEILGLVGESGSGKTTTALALLGYAGPGARITAGTLEVDGEPIAMDESMRRLRGARVAYVPQDPGRALNPVLRIAESVADVLETHGRSAEIPALFDAVGLPGSDEFCRRWPHQLSGGQQQRVTIATALSCEPPVLVLDEPTTGLDVVTQSKVLARLTELRDELGLSMIYVTHDLAVVAQIADRVAVMYGGRIVEEGPAHAVVTRPRHPYTRGLLGSSPDHRRPSRLETMPGSAVSIGERPAGCSFAPRCPLATDRCRETMPALEQTPAALVRCFHWEQTPELRRAPLERESAAARGGEPVLRVEGLRLEHGSARRTTVVAADDVSFDIAPGSCVGLVGESGSGKTTIARAIAGLHPIAGGTVVLQGEPLPKVLARRTAEQRRKIQLISQNPAEALNPRKRVREQIARPLKILRGLPAAQIDAEVDRLLASVRLSARIAERYPGELSGGERQRVAIARGLAADPELLVCDEITSALDVSVQAAVIAVLEDLRRERGLSLLFITHDLGVVASIADDVLVLQHGLVREQGPAQAILAGAADSYTRALLDAAPSLSDVGASARPIQSAT